MKHVIFLLLVTVLCLGVNNAVAQQTGAILIGAEVVALPLTIAPGTLDFTALQNGMTYTAIADALNQVVTPVTGAGEGVAMGESVITGDVNANVLVTFVLPSKLYGGVGGSINISFNALSAAWGTSGAQENFFDPNTPTVLALDAAGNSNILLGGIVQVPANSAPDTYVGEAVIAVQYTGA